MKVVLSVVVVAFWAFAINAIITDHTRQELFEEGLKRDAEMREWDRQQQESHDALMKKYKR